MTVANWMILAAGLMPYLTVGIAKADRNFDNASPREWLGGQSGFRARADWAHRNHFETFPFFAAAVLVAQQAHAPQARVDLVSVTFIVIRIAYTAVYLMNLATVRSIIWAAGTACVVSLFLMSA